MQQHPEFLAIRGKQPVPVYCIKCCTTHPTSSGGYCKLHYQKERLRKFKERSDSFRFF